MPDIKFDAPAYSADQALALAQTHYGLTGSLQALPSERDQNFLLTTGASDRFVIKIANAAEPVESLTLQNQTLGHLAEHAPGLALPRVVPAGDGREIVPLPNDVGGDHHLRLFTFVPGVLWSACNPHTSSMRRSLGDVLGRMDRALEGFHPAAADRDLKWDLSRASWIRDYLQFIEEPERRALVAGWLDYYDDHVSTRLAGLRRGVIYNDANDANILVSPGDPRQRTVIGVIDFGDLVHSQTIGELAIGCAYASMGAPDPLSAAAEVAAGYHAAYPLSDDELAVLFPLICLRLCVSVTNAAYQRVVEPGNAYLLVSEQPAWALLEKLSRIHPEFAQTFLRSACGLAPCPGAAAVADWLSGHRAELRPLVEASLSQAVVFDFSVDSLDLGTNADFENPAILADRLNNQLLQAGAPLGIGRYDEARPFYSGGEQSLGPAGPEAATIHIGLDLYMQSGAAVFAPLAGVVHLVQRETLPTALILRHQPADGPIFYTLYRHLDAMSLAGWEPGMEVAARAPLGAVQGSFTRLPAHLHFQLLADLLGQGADVPGLVRPSERAAWLGASLDPALVLALPAGAKTAPDLSAEAILAERRRRLGRNLSISFQKPVHLVRGYLQHLFDADGRRYLDAVNNVPHVGHSHPRVVRAAQGQLAVLNTNSRYLHANIVRYAERLAATLPEPLSVVYFVCSGSEANELALRLARTYTDSPDTIVLDMAYHGNTNALVEVSPYKYEGPGGSGPRPYIHKVPIPDTYRGPHPASDPQAGLKYAQAVAEAAAAVQARGNRPTFLAESLMGSAGQIPLAPGYLAEAYRLVRAAGGVCIADEVQVGMGRVGERFWGFELHGAVPDIVTIGKPIGNGHPLGAVVTTPAIADAFNNGMEYFNTFGGNPVSCAIGLAVLDVIADEDLQAHARDTGGYLLDGLRQLQAEHSLIGDVRGAGLFLGVELVRSRETRERALAEAAYIVNRLKDHGILLSADFNCLKIKPPLPFNRADADYLVTALDSVLREDFARI